MMKKRILVRYLFEAGFCPETGDRDIDRDQYKENEVKSVESGLVTIRNNDPDGCGTIMEQVDTIFGWDTEIEHHVDGGVIFDTTTFDIEC